MRLAPFYDLVSTEIYGNKFRRKFAFAIAGENSPDKINKKHIIAFEKVLRLREGTFLKRLLAMKEKILSEFSGVKKDLLLQLAKNPVPDKIYEIIE